jgi:hypothetical protein
VENIAALPIEAAEAEEMLREGANLLQVYEMLASLEGTSMKAQQALESGTNVNLQEATNLNSYFQKVVPGLPCGAGAAGRTKSACVQPLQLHLQAPGLASVPARTFCLPAASCCRSK